MFKRFIGKTRFAPIVVAIFGLLLSGFIFELTLRVERTRAEANFREVANQRISTIRANVDDSVATVQMLAHHLETSPEGVLRRDSFSAYAAPALSMNPFLQALEWLPRVTAAERPEMEARARKDGFENFTFRSLESGREIATEGQRSEYYPVYFLEPYVGNEAALGLDLASDPVRRAGIERAATLRQVTAIERLRFIEGQGQYSVLIFAPVLQRTAPTIPGDTSSTPIGIAVGVLRVGNMLSISQQGIDPEDPKTREDIVSLALFDLSAPEEQRQLYPPSSDKVSLASLNRILHQDDRFMVGDRRWLIVATPGPGYSSLQSSANPYLVLGLGLLITAICVLYLRLVAQSEGESAMAAQELLRLNRALRARNRIAHALGQATDENTLLQTAVEIIVDEGAYAIAWIGIPDNDEEGIIRLAAHAGEGSTFATQLKISWKEGPSGQGPTGTAVRERRPVMISDAARDPSFEPWRETAEKLDLHAALCVPMMLGSEVIAAISVYSHGTRVIGNDEAQLIIEIAGDLEFGIKSIRSRQEAEVERDKRQQLEAQLQQSQKLEALGRLAGGIAHDFNNLLMVILAHTDLLMLKLPEGTRDRAEKIKKSATRAAELTRQLLAFSRKQTVQLDVMTLNEVIRGVSDMLPRLVREDIDVRILLEEHPWPVKLDRVQFEQVIMNLVVNARDAMPTGGCLTLECRNVEVDSAYILKRPIVPPGRYVSISVMDTGTGMSRETEARLFEPFFTTKPAGKGTGLGLSMVYGIVKRANGFVWVYTELGMGTTFRIYLPVDDQGEYRDPGGDEREYKGTSEKANILVVEDDDSLREAITEFLQAGGHNVLCARDQDEGCRLGLEHRDRLDVILTDVILKGGNGRFVVKYLETQGCRFPAIFMSGYTADTTARHGVLEEGTMFLQKPFSQADLLAKIHEALRTARR